MKITSKFIKKSLSIVLGITSVFIIIVMNKNVSFASTNSIKREYMQDIIVSTGLSYLHNKRYSEYDQYGIDNNSTIYWRNFKADPESISRANFFHVDCSSFVGKVYIYSLGYDFSDYYSSSTATYSKYNTTTSRFEQYYMSGSVNNYKEGYINYGKGMATSTYTAIGKKEASVSSGVEYINNKNTNQNVVVYYYSVDGTETDTEKETIKNNLINTLQKGDIVVYRTKTITSSSSGTSNSTNGHAMLYVGDAIDTEGGFIHSTGYDYSIKDTGVSIGDDSFSIRYDGMYKLKNSLFVNTSTTKDGVTTTKNSVAFTILRPINTYCNKDDCELDEKANSNVHARVDLKGLRTEQYSSADNVVIDSELNVKEDKNLWSNSKYNSINIGDNLKYSVYLYNNSQINYCYGSAAYTSKSSCESAGYIWKTSTSNSIIYDNLLIEATIPENTEYVSCNWSCTYDSKNKKVSWKITDSNSLKNGQYRTYRYEVKVNGGKEIINEGIKITTQNGNVLKLSEMVSKINPTLSKLNIVDLTDNIIKFKNLVNLGKIKYDSSATNFKYDLDNISSVNISPYGFIKNIYYNTLNIDLGFISASNIKNAIFNVDSSSNYAKKTETEISNLTNETYQKLNKMLVKGFYGGRYLRGNDNGDRSGRLRIADLEIGDIIVSFSTTSGTVAGTSSMYMYLGTDVNSESTVVENEKNSIFVRFENDNGINLFTQNSNVTSYTLFNELYSKDLFVVLRPTQLYGTTVNYKNEVIDGEKLSVEYSSYQHLSTNTKNNILTLEFGKKLSSNLNFSNEIVGLSALKWYSNSNLTNEIKNGDSLVTNNSHDVYAKWKHSNSKLPKLTGISGYTHEGWYSDSNLTVKVANPEESYEITKDETLYAKWTANTYQVKYNANGGTGSMSNGSHTYDTSQTLKANAFKKVGYTLIGWATKSTGNVIYKDKASVSNLTTEENGIVNLYAVWEPVEYSITYNLNGGKLNATAQNKYTIESNSYELLSPTKLGYIFEGWYEKVDFSGEKVETLKEGSTGNKVYYAKWKALESELEDFKILNGYIYLEKGTIINNIGLKEEYKTKTYRDSEITGGKYGTGYRIDIYRENTKVGEYISIIRGDTTGDGNINIADIAKTYQHLKKKITMEEEYKKAGNVVESDEEIMINDVAKLYQYIKGKINNLD